MAMASGVSGLGPPRRQANSQKLSFPENSELRGCFRVPDSNFSQTCILSGVAIRLDRQKWLPFRYMRNIEVYSGYQRLFLFVTFPIC